MMKSGLETGVARAAVFSLLILVAGGCRNRTSPLPEDIRQIKLDIPATEGDAMSKRVLVVCNIDSDESIAITEYYCRKRNIPPQNVLQIRTTLAETISQTPMVWEILKPIEKKRKELGGIDFVALTKGIPIRVVDSFGPSVDGWIAAGDLDIEPVFTIDNKVPSGEEIERLENPFFGSSERFDGKQFNMVLVTRLDGYEVSHVLKMIDHAVEAKPLRGPFYLDQGEHPDRDMSTLNVDLKEAAVNLQRNGKLAWLEKTKAFKTPPEPVMGYVSWGSNDVDFSREKYNKVRFLPGAIGETFVSTSGRSMMPLVDGQSQIGDLVRQGITGVKGYVSEPFQFALARPSILFDRYTKGWTLAESFYAASPVIKWKDIVIGDPIAAPYAK